MYAEISCKNVSYDQILKLDQIRKRRESKIDLGHR